MQPAHAPAEEASSSPTLGTPRAQTAEALSVLLRQYLSRHPQAVLLEDGKPIFDFADAQYRLTTEHDRCLLQVWSSERNLVRSVTSVTPRAETLRLATHRFGQPQSKTLTLAPTLERREPCRREPARQHYRKLLERVLSREFPDWHTEGFRAAMDLERSFGPAYVRGSLSKGTEAWAIIGTGGRETQPTIDGILTLGVLWLHHCRERSGGHLAYKGLRLIVPKGAATLTLARLPWMNTAAAHWELFELDERTEELLARDPADQGNLQTRLVRHPDEGAARERFAVAIAQLYALIPSADHPRVEQRLRSTSELAFLLHGLEFARARISMAPGSFTHVLEVTIGTGSTETVLSAGTRLHLEEHVAELFHRRHPQASRGARQLRPFPPGRGIGPFTGRPAHGRQSSDAPESTAPASETRLQGRHRSLAAQQDPLFRAVPERWLESVLRENLAPLTRSLAPSPASALHTHRQEFANDVDPDNRGNRADVSPRSCSWSSIRSPADRVRDRLIPRFDPRFVYTQVPAIAGAGDRGMLDLLGITEDGRLAVIELKAADDLQLALQGLDYWIRVRHHLGDSTANHGKNDLQAHGYFCGVELSSLPPRLYLVAPALHIHPATETILRYISPRVEWSLVALDERWRQEVRVVWRKSGGQLARAPS